MTPDRRPARPGFSEGYQLATRVFSVAIIGIGVAICALTLARGGGPLAVGILMGLVFIGVGAARLYIAMRG